MAGARHAKVSQSLIIDLPEKIHVDVVGLEGIGILAKTDRLQPFSDLAHALSRSSRNLASFESRGSRPSMSLSRPTMPDEAGSSVPPCLPANEWTEWQQVVAVETGHLELLYRSIIVRAGSNGDAGEQHSKR
jgi:hypothetical protein